MAIKTNVEILRRDKLCEVGLINVLLYRTKEELVGMIKKLNIYYEDYED